MEDKPTIIPGDELVAKGITKNDGSASLPEIGMKDSTPNGSWLEQKQVQSTLEVRKNLIEVDRIEKHGSLSHAEWRDDLNLAEVTQQSGGYWQYTGHSIGKKVYLFPEEALFLMEVNCLQLKHNEVTMSLQKAYPLLLQGKINNSEYKVYAYLCRLGYKVFRHNIDAIKSNGKLNETVEEISHKMVGNNSIQGQVNPSDCIDTINNKSDNENETENTKQTIEDNCVENDDTENMKSDKATNIPNTEEMTQTNDPNKISEDSDVTQESQVETNESYSNSMEVDRPNTINNKGECYEDTNQTESSINNKRTIEETDNTEENIKRIKKDDNFTAKESKLNRLKNRLIAPCNSETLHKVLKIIPDLFQKDTVTITVPDEQYIPKNVFTNKLSYVLNMANIRAKAGGPKSTESPNYSMNDEVNNINIRQIKSSSITTSEGIPNLLPTYNRYPRNMPTFRPIQVWKTRCSVEAFQCNFFYHRRYLPNYYINPRIHSTVFSQIPNANNVYSNQSGQHGQSATRVPAGDNVQQYHLDCLKNLALRLKNLVAAGNTQTQNIQSLHKLLQTYNRRYETRMRLTDKFDIVDENVMETIELEDDEETFVIKQRTRLEQISKDHILNKLLHLSQRLKKLEAMGKAVATHRRAFSNVVKHYNKRYNADIYLNNDYEIIDRRQVTLDLSSDSDCVIDEPPKPPKMFRNPFNVLRERLAGAESNVSNNTTETMLTHYDELKQVFQNWLPDANDFGRAEVVHNHHMLTRHMEYYREEYLYDFLQAQQLKYKNWLEAKIHFLTQMEDTAGSHKNDYSPPMDNETPDSSGLKPIIKPEDCDDMPSMLEKLRIIKPHEDVDGKTSLTIKFDVYKRDVQNFRKSKRPNPQFRVICVNESSSFPSGEDIQVLHKKYDDNVPIVFAVIGSGSICFLQINKYDVPVYISNNDFP